MYSSFKNIYLTLIKNNLMDISKRAFALTEIPLNIHDNHFIKSSSSLITNSLVTKITTTNESDDTLFQINLCEYNNLSTKQLKRLLLLKK